MTKPTPTFYILHGEDDYSRKEAVKQMQASMNDPSNINVATLDGTQVSAMAVINAVSAIPFLSDRRLVIVEGMLEYLEKRSKSAKAEVEVLVEMLPKLPDFARLIFHETTTLKKTHPVIQLVHSDPRGYEKEFNAPPNLAQWIVKQAKNQYEVEIEPQAAQALASVIDKDLRMADNELAKLAAYVDGERPIQESDVALLTTYVPEPDIFRMVDAIGQQDGKTAMQICTALLTKQEPFSLFGMINRQFRLLILAREHMDQTGSVSGIAAAAGVPDFIAKKLGQQARAFASVEQLELIYHKLAEFDFNIKMGKYSDEMALQLFIAGVTK